MNEQAIILGLRAAASTMELVSSQGFNLHRLAIAVDEAARRGRPPTDEELLQTSDRLDGKIDRVFGTPADTPAPGAEPNDMGDSSENQH